VIAFPFWSFGDAVSCSVEPTATVDAPDTTTDVSTGGACMVRTTLLVAVNAPDVATTVTVTLPAATAVTSPVVDTVARAVLELDHANVAPMFPPNWSRALAVSCSVWPTVTDVEGALIETVVRTGFAAATVSERVAVSVTPPAVACALITTVPTASGVTSPVVLTDATFGALVSQLTVAAIGFPDWSSALAVNGTAAWPTWRLVVAGEITTDVSTGGATCTVTAAVPVTLAPPAVASAEIVALPTARAFTSPDTDTAAISGADDDQTTDAAIVAPVWSRGVAVSCAVWPTVSAVVPDTDTLVRTGGAVTVTVSVAEVVAEPATAVAVIVADPAPMAVTSPVGETNATLDAELVQLIAAEIALPDWSFGAALNWSVCPAARTVLAPAVGATLTVVRTGVGLEGSDGPPPESPPPPEQAATRMSEAARKRFVPRRGTKFPSPGT